MSMPSMVMLPLSRSTMRHRAIISVLCWHRHFQLGLLWLSHQAQGPKACQAGLKQRECTGQDTLG